LLSLLIVDPSLSILLQSLLSQASLEINAMLLVLGLLTR
jgi:hypothetical protein